MRDLSPTMAALMGRYDTVRQIVEKGRRVVRERREESARCAERELEAATAYKEAYATAYLKRAIDPSLIMSGMKRPLENQIRQHAILDTMEAQRMWDAMRALSKSADDALHEANRQLRALEKEFDSITALAHAYNREQKVEAAALSLDL